MLIYPNWDPVAFHLGPLAVHWYGLMYLLGFSAAWGLALYRASRVVPVWRRVEVNDLIFYAALGVIVGGRVGYTLIYNWSGFVSAPWVLFQVWLGGMSFHGGLLGVAVALFIFARRCGRHWLDVVDFVVPLVPIGLCLGRFGNFINGELYGRVTHVPWAMVFPHSDGLPRHPSSLYECLLEGVVLFALVWWFSARPRPRFAVGGLFLLLYGVFRFSVEFFRAPDPQLGFLAGHWLTMGQLLSFPMILVGCVSLICIYGRSYHAGIDQ